MPQVRPLVAANVRFETAKVPLDLKPEPALAMREHFVMSSIRSREVAPA
jgi:hypothetical protein